MAAFGDGRLETHRTRQRKGTHGELNGFCVVRLAGWCRSSWKRCSGGLGIVVVTGMAADRRGRRISLRWRD